MNRFSSPGAAAGRALQEVLVQREAQRRQALLDGIMVENTLRQRAREDAAMARAEQVARQADADRMAGIFGPNVDLSPEAAATLQDGGYQVDTRSTLPARTIGGVPITMPGQPWEGAPGVPAQVLDPVTYSRRNETFAEKQAREKREAEQAERDEARQFRNDQAVAQRTFQAEQNEANRQARAEQSQADRDLKALIASMSQSQSAETRALGNELKRLQVQAAQDKLDAQRVERQQATQARDQGRAQVRDLAQSLINDPALGSITGAIEGRRDTFLQGANVDALRRYNQLVNMLSLEGRAKLKGQGAVSDFEGRMLASAMSALDRAAGPEAVKKHLQAIVSVFTDDAPGGNGRDLGKDW